MKEALNYCIGTLELDKSQTVEIKAGFNELQRIAYSAYNLAVIKTAKALKRRPQSNKPLYQSLTLQKQNNVNRAIQSMENELSTIMSNQNQLFT